VLNAKTVKFAIPDTYRTKVLPDNLFSRHAHLRVSSNFMIASYPVMISLQQFLFPFHHYISLIECYSGTTKNCQFGVNTAFELKSKAITPDNTGILFS